MKIMGKVVGKDILKGTGKLNECIRRGWEGRIGQVLMWINLVHKTVFIKILETSMHLCSDGRRHLFMLSY